MLDKASVVALGPGLGQAAWGHALWTTALDAGLPFAEAMRRGTGAGSLACTTAGAQPSIPTAATVDALLARPA